MSQLTYLGLKQVGSKTFSKCSRCKTWGMHGLYREQYTQGLQGHDRRVCSDCIGVVQ